MFVVASLRRGAPLRHRYHSTFYIIFPIGVRPRENHVPEPRNLPFGFISPGEVAIVTIKPLRKNLHGKQHARDCRGEKFPGHLRIFNVGRIALRAAQGGPDIWIRGFPFPHQFMRFAEVIFFYLHFYVGLGFRHESDALQMAVADNFGADAGLLKPVTEMFRFRLFVEGCDRDHGFGSGLAAA